MCIRERENRRREELTTTKAYVSLLRTAKDRSDQQAGSLEGMMGAAAALLCRRRRGSALSRAWRRWASGWRRRREETEAEARAAGETLTLFSRAMSAPVPYTHLTLPTNIEV